MELSLDDRGFFTGSTNSNGDADVDALDEVGDAGVDCKGERERNAVGMGIFGDAIASKW